MRAHALSRLSAVLSVCSLTLTTGPTYNRDLLRGETQSAGHVTDIPTVSWGFYAASGANATTAQWLTRLNALSPSQATREKLLANLPTSHVGGANPGVLNTIPFSIQATSGVVVYDQNRAAVLVDPGLIVLGSANLTGARVIINSGFPRCGGAA